MTKLIPLTTDDECLRQLVELRLGIFGLHPEYTLPSLVKRLTQLRAYTKRIYDKKCEELRARFEAEGVEPEGISDAVLNALDGTPEDDLVDNLDLVLTATADLAGLVFTSVRREVTVEIDVGSATATKLTGTINVGPETLDWDWHEKQKLPPRRKKRRSHDDSAG